MILPDDAGTIFVKKGEIIIFPAGSISLAVPNEDNPERENTLVELRTFLPKFKFP